MRERVCIVLNERESAKEKAADALAQKLAEHDITASRLKIDQHIYEIIRERCPQLLVMDYLIGDYSTGLDILSSLCADFTEEAGRPKVVFLTDEPSVPVAVQAMKLGALDYFELDHPLSVSNTAQLVVEHLRQCEQPRFLKPAPRRRLDDLVAHSPTMLRTIEALKVALLKPAPMIVIHGKPGCGLSTLGTALQSERPECYWRTIDLRIFSDPFPEFFGHARRSPPGLVLGRNLSVVVENAEEDGGELLDFIAARQDSLWDNNTGSQLIVLTACPDTFNAWRRIVHCEALTVPDLQERSEDIPALVQRFQLEAAENSGKKIKPFQAELISWIVGLEWPGEVKQLWAVVIDSAIASTFSSKNIKTLIEEARERWIEDQTASPPPELSALRAARMLEACGFSYRVAAARLGCSLRHLMQLVRGDSAAEDKPVCPEPSNA